MSQQTNSLQTVDKPQTLITKENMKTLTKSGRVVVILFNSVYDLTDFYLEHPGGKRIIQRNIGKDATELFVN